MEVVLLDMTSRNLDTEDSDNSGEDSDHEHEPVPPQQQQRRAAQKLGVTVEKVRQLFSEPDAPQPRRAPTPQQQQSMRKAREAMEHYGLEENDIFITPDEIFEVIGKHLGISVEQAKAIWDPCPAPRDDGIFAPDGLTIAWAELTYCNPPFSQFHEWLGKAAPR